MSTCDKTEWLGVQDLAAETAVPPATVYYWNHTGTGPPYIRIGKHVRYRRRDVEAWYNSRQVHAG